MTSSFDARFVILFARSPHETLIRFCGTVSDAGVVLNGTFPVTVFWFLKEKTAVVSVKGKQTITNNNLFKNSFRVTTCVVTRPSLPHFIAELAILRCISYARGRNTEIERASDLRWKRAGNVEKQVPSYWKNACPKTPLRSHLNIIRIWNNISIFLSFSAPSGKCQTSSAMTSCFSDVSMVVHVVILVFVRHDVTVARIIIIVKSYVNIVKQDAR